MEKETKLPIAPKEPENLSEEEQDLENKPTNRTRGKKLVEIMQKLADDFENGQESPLSEKFEFLLEEADFQQPEIDDFVGKKPYYTKSSAERDKDYVDNREEAFDDDKMYAKAAEAAIGQAIRNNEFFYSSDGIRAIVANPVTRYDDIAHGIDQAVTIITADKKNDKTGEIIEHGKEIPFAFDITIGQSKETFVKKLFRPSTSTSGINHIGQSKLKYGQIPELDENGVYKSIEQKTIDPILRVTLAYSKKDVNDMAEAITVEDQGTALYSNPSEKTILHTTLQIYEQCVFYLNAAKTQSETLSSRRRNETDADKIAKVDQEIEELSEQIKQYDELTKTLEPSLRQAYIQARKRTIKNKGNARPNEETRNDLLCIRREGTATGALIDTLHYYEGWSEEDKKNEDSRIEERIKESLQAIDDDYFKKHPNSMMGPSYTADQISDIEFSAVMASRQEKIDERHEKMQERLDEGKEEYERLEAEKLLKRMTGK